MTRIETRIAARVAVLLLALSPLGAARAELLRCTGPDGKTLYTDDKSQCPAAEPFQPAAVLHGTERQKPVEPPARLRSVVEENADAGDGGGAEQWRGLREAKQEELRRVEFERNELVSYVAWCNRGGSVIGRDDAGIKRQIDCGSLRGQMASLDARKAELDEYLEHGLEDECRRAGCEPGWIR